MKNHDFTPKNHIFSNFRGGGEAPGAPLGTTRHNFGRGSSNFIKVWFQLSNWFQTKRFLCEFPIGSYVKPSSAVGAILVEGPNTFLEENHPMTISSKFGSN